MENITTTIISLTAFITAIATLIVNIMKAKKKLKIHCLKKYKSNVVLILK